MIIVEGMDNTGKTTLIETIKEAFGEQIDVIKPPGPFKSQEELESWMRQDMVKLRTEAFPKLTIYDRYTTFSEPIYGPTIRGSSMLSNELFSESINMMLDSSAYCPVVVIYCRPPIHKIVEFGEREQMEGVIDHSMALLKEYEDLMGNISNMLWARCQVGKQCNMTLVPYDWTNPVSLVYILKLVAAHLDIFKAKRLIDELMVKHHTLVMNSGVEMKMIEYPKELQPW